MASEHSKRMFGGELPTSVPTEARNNRTSRRGPGPRLRHGPRHLAGDLADRVDELGPE